MNRVELIGRLTRDVDLRYTTNTNNAVAHFTVAVDKPSRDKNADAQADFLPITVFGKQAENCERYLKKGSRVGIEGRLQSGSYTNKNGDRVFTLDVVGERVEFLSGKNEVPDERDNYSEPESTSEYDGFSQTEEDIPF